MPTLKIKTITNRFVSYNYEDDMTVRNLKEKIQQSQGMHIDQFRLIFGGQQMAQVKKISDYNIKAGDSIHMIISLTG